MKDLRTNSINGVNIQTLLDKVVKSTDEYIPSINVTRLMVHSVDTPVLSNNPISKFIKTDKDIILEGALKVNGDVVVNSNLHVKGLVDNCTVSPSHVLLRRGNQSLECRWKKYFFRMIFLIYFSSGTLSVDKLYAGKVDVGKMNGQDLNYLYRNVITSGTEFTLKNPRFHSLIAAEIDVGDGLINGIDLEELVENSMKLEGNQVVTGNLS